MLKLTVAIFLCALFRPGSCGQLDDDQTMDVYRLPTETKPISYELKFIPNFNGINSTFSGETKINISVVMTTDVITLNLKDLNVTNVTVADVTNAKWKNVPVKDLVNTLKNEQFKIYLGKSIISNRKVQVSISYGGKIRNDMSGLYLSSYQEGNTTKWMAVTQFEPTSARKAFPCYDEPSYKATFKISVVKQKNQIALSNMPISTVQKGTKTDVVYFEDTPLMPTYLAALYVGEFVPNVNQSSITVYTQPEYSYQTAYVSADAPKHLSVLEAYTDIPYSLPKMDLLAIPDFSAGAMENWGMTTYREYYILLHEETKTKMKIRSSEVVQHEFTHQWFGNLVTCEWWDYLWLNEGFARYFQYFATKMVKTSWPMEELFVVETHQESLKYDQTPRHPITSSVKTTQEINSIFDTISYSKAASVIRMLTHIVTEPVFKLSLNDYLNSKSYGVSTPLDLYNAIDNQLVDSGIDLENGLTVNEFMTNWTTQSGYPVVLITKNDTSNRFTLIQSQFLVNATEKNSNTSAWIIGLTYTTQVSKNFSITKPTIWTNKSSLVTEIDVPKNLPNESWYIFNIQSTGFYRVNYDTKNWMKLINQLNSTPTDIHVLNRAQLIDDAFTLAKAGHLNYSVPLHLSKYLKKEKHIIPWYTAMNRFNYLIQRMPRNKQGYENFKAHVSKLAGTIYKQLEELVSKKNNEYSVLNAWDAFSSWACRLENKYCMNKALEYFKKWQNGEKISADIKDAAFCIGVKNSTGSSIFNSLFDLYKKTKSISEKISIELALGCSANRTQLEEYINHILDGPQGPIKAKDYKSVISSIAATPLGLDVLSDFLLTNINITLNKLSNGEDIVTFIYSTIAQKITNDQEIEKIRYLKDNTTIPISVKMSFEKSYENVNHNLLWFNTYSDGISQWALENLETEESETTLSPGTTITPKISNTTETPIDISSTVRPSSSTSNRQNTFTILLFTISTVLITMCI